MVGDWPTVPLGDLLQSGRAISYGIVQPGHHDPTGVPIVRVGDVRGGHVATDSPLRVARNIESQYARTRLRGGELLLTLVGTVGETAVASPELSGWNLARAIAIVPVKEEVGAFWVRAALQMPSVRHLIKARLNTTVQATLNLGDVAELPITLPPAKDRAIITNLLGALDDKIELNRRMTETLEAMAQTLFKGWFVDFDPVRAKVEGRFAGLPDELAGMFPDSFDEDGVPKGWSKRSVYDFARIIYGAPFASSKFNNDHRGLPLIRVRDLGAHNPAIFTDEQHRVGHVIQPGDIVVGMDGEFRCHLWRGPPAYLNQRLCHFEPLPSVPKSFVALALHEPLAVFEASAVGTTVIHLGKKDLDAVEFIWPGKDVLRAFGKMSDQLLDRAIKAAQQSRTLAAARDTLLPKLISGELRIADAEQRIAAA